MARPLNDLVLVFRRVFRFARYAGIVLFAVTLVLIGREVANVFDAAWRIHPAMAWVFLAGVLFLVGRLLGVPIYRFLKMPAVMEPPKLPAKDEQYEPSHVRAELDFLTRYLKHLKKNPALDESLESIVKAEAELVTLRQKVSGIKDPQAARAEVGKFELTRLNPILDPLDREVDKLIRNEALGVGIATALSPNGTLDSFIVLWRNANLVSRIANVYYGRPGVRGSFRILRDVSAAALLATYLEGLSEAAGGVLRGIFGSVVGVVAGPLVDGGVNALATLRIGYLAKARCRSFKAWTEATRMQALKDALAAAKDRSKEVMAEVAKAAGVGLAGLGGKVGDAVKGGFSSLFKKLRGEPDVDPAPESAG